MRVFVPGRLSNVPAIWYVLRRGAAIYIFQVFLVSLSLHAVSRQGLPPAKA